MKKNVIMLGFASALVIAMVGCAVPVEPGSEVRDPDVSADDSGNGKLADGILASDKDREADSEENYVNCVGWYNGGYKCNTLCDGLAWSYTNWSYPAITYGQCTDKAQEFCFLRNRAWLGACWGT